MARNISLFNLLTVAKIKNGRETKIAVDASGSAIFRLNNNAILTINKEIKRCIDVPFIMGGMWKLESLLNFML